MEVCGHLHAHAALHPGVDPSVPTEEKAGWARGPAWTPWRREIFLVIAGNRILVVRPVPSSLREKLCPIITVGLFIRTAFDGR